MSESRSHKTTANRLANKYNTGYNQGKGPDIKTPDITIEIETPDTVPDAGRQLSGHRCSELERAPARFRLGCC